LVFCIGFTLVVPNLFGTVFSGDRSAPGGPGTYDGKVKMDPGVRRDDERTPG